MKSIFLQLLLSLSLLSVGVAQQPEGEGTVPQALLQALFSADNTEEQLEAAIKAAGKAGIPRQQIIEAKLIWGLRRQNEAYLIKMLPELKVLAENFDSTQSAGIRNADELRSYILFVEAAQAKSQGNAEVFKKNILEAVWLNPAQAAVFVQAIEQQRRLAKMATLTLDLKTVLTTSAGEATTLEDQLAGKKALLIDFWASWCGPCMQLMPELKKKADSLSKHGIVVAGMNKDDKEPESTAERIRNDQGIEFPWLVEPKDRPFTKLLEIDSIPRMILVDPQGKVLFNGHPQDPQLWVALQKLDAAITPPSE